MKKFFLFIFILFLCPAIHVNAKEAPLKLEDQTISFTASGYTPKAECDIEEILPQITYFAIDMSNSSPISFPIYDPGTYQIFAKFEGNAEYEAAEASAIITIEPVVAKIITNYSKVAYSRMENPINYTIEPSWAAEYIDIIIDYYPIETADSIPENKIPAPTDLGLYYTVFNATSKISGIVCENKYMLYEISAYRGKKLPASERGASVPPSFKCTFETINTVYDKNAVVSCPYTLYPAAINGEIFYRYIYSDGTYSDYFKTPPVEPGEYECAYFLGSTCIGTGNIFIDKQKVNIIIENTVAEYIQGGISPEAKCESKDVELSFTAFVIDENGKVTLEEASVPINRCGKFSVIAYPKDTEHYKRTYAYGTIEITPATPEIKITKTEFIFDGKEKNIGVEISPKNISHSVEYYEWEDRENKNPLSSAPSKAGKYMVIITAYDKNGNYTTVSKSAVMNIEDNSISTGEENKLTKTGIAILTISGVAIAILLASGVVFTVRAIKRKKQNNI